MDNLASLFAPTVDQIREHERRIADALTCLRAPWAAMPTDPYLLTLEQNRKAAVALLQGSEVLCRALLTFPDPEPVVVVHEPCDNPACQLPGCRDERDRLEQLGAELEAASHPKADPYPNERELIRAGEGY